MYATTTSASVPLLGDGPGGPSYRARKGCGFNQSRWAGLVSSGATGPIRVPNCGVVMNDAELMVAVEGAPWMPWTHRRPNPKQNTEAVQHRLGREAEQAQHGLVPSRDAAAPVFDALQERLLAL